jgi:hypothetical protein
LALHRLRMGRAERKAVSPALGAGRGLGRPLELTQAHPVGTQHDPGGRSTRKRNCCVAPRPSSGEKNARDHRPVGERPVVGRGSGAAALPRLSGFCGSVLRGRGQDSVGYFDGHSGRHGGRLGRVRTRSARRTLSLPGPASFDARHRRRSASLAHRQLSSVGASNIDRTFLRRTLRLKGRSRCREKERRPCACPEGGVRSL